MSTKRKLRVFLCHASQDKSVVRELRQRLEEEGWIDPWLDEKKLLPGEDWRTLIEEAVETSDLVVICLSNNSVDKEGFVQKELRYAREISLEKPEGTIFLIPLRLDDCTVPRGLRFFQWADYFGEQKNQTYIELLDSFSIRRQQVIRREEEKERKETEEREKREREEMAHKEVEERVRREAEELARKLAEEKLRQDIEERAHKNELEKIRKEAYEKARKEAEEKARLEMEIRVRKEVEERESQKEKRTNRDIKPINISSTVTLVFACIVLIVISLILYSTVPSITNWLSVTPQSTPVNSLAPSPAISTNVSQTLSSNRFILIPLASAHQPDGSQAPGKVAAENLQMLPGFHVLNDIPLHYEYEVYTENSDVPQFPKIITIPYQVVNPISLYFLIQADWGMAEFNGKQVGKIVINFESGASYEYSLVLGENIRDWGRDIVNYAVTTVSSPDIISGWDGIAPDGRPGGMDLLKVYLPEQFRSETIDTISIFDTTLETTGNNNPGIHILSITAEIVDATPGPWNYQIEKIPASSQTLSWDLKSGEIFILTGGSFQYNDYVCGGKSQQICILTITALNDITITINNLVPENNWLAVSDSISIEEVIGNVQNESWLSPNCGNGCSYATVLNFTNEILQSNYQIDNPSP